VKRITSSVVLILSIVTGYAFGQEKQGPSDGHSLKFELPPPRVLNLNKPVTCTAIASAWLLEQAREPEDFEHSKLYVEVKKGTDSLRLWLEGKTLIVQTGNQKPDRYRVSGRTNQWLIAMHYGGLMPAAYSITLDEKSGFAVWSLIEPIFFPVSVYPHAQTIYLQCIN